MIDEKKVIKKLQDRIDDFVLKHPDKKDCEAVQTVEEFIQMLEEECKEQKNGWILCSERMPEEHDTQMKKFKGTSQWESFMWEKQSDTVLVTCLLESGECYVRTSNTHDGKWHLGDGLIRVTSKDVIAWQPLPEVFKERED